MSLGLVRKKRLRSSSVASGLCDQAMNQAEASVRSNFRPRMIANAPNTQKAHSICVARLT